MSPIESSPHFEPVENALLDRLVDGSLDTQTRRRLLVSLDQQPDGWRRCALAFLEAQSWTEALASEPHTLPPQVPVPAQIQHAPGAGLFTRAAGLMLAVGLGWLMARTMSTDAARSISPRADAVVASQPSTAPTQHSAPPAAYAAPRQAAILASTPASDGHSSSDARTVPASLRRELENQGFQIEATRAQAKLSTRTGRTINVPLDAVRIQYVGNRTY